MPFAHRLPAVAALAVLSLAAGCARQNRDTEPTTATPATPEGAVASADLRNTYWRLIALGDKPVTVTDNQREPHIILRPDSEQVVGSGGCNRMFGTYTLTADNLTFSGIGATKMACPGSMDVETAFLPSLQRVAKWKITGQRLDLLDASGALVARFEARTMK